MNQNEKSNERSDKEDEMEARELSESEKQKVERMFYTRETEQDKNKVQGRMQANRLKVVFMPCRTSEEI